MGIIKVNGIRLRAYHGCMPEEAVTGGNFVVDVAAETDFSKAVQSDELKDTVDYAVIFEIVKSEMGVRSKLIEHVAHRIVVALRKKYPTVKKFSVTVTKIAPPITGPVDDVSVTEEG